MSMTLTKDEYSQLAAWFSRPEKFLLIKLLESRQEEAMYRLVNVNPSDTVEIMRQQVLAKEPVRLFKGINEEVTKVALQN